jgi:hypothetical protein
MVYTGKVEYADRRRIRESNTAMYRLAHWPIWIWVFFLAPGPLTFNLFAHGGSRSSGLWLLLVAAGTGVAGLCGQLPGSEPRPYILRFTEDKPNPLYRRICYTFAWNAAVSFALLNLAGLVFATASGEWRMQQMYFAAYYPLCAAILLAGALGLLPRAGRTTRGEGSERRVFYGTVWSVTISQTILLVLWKALPPTRAMNPVKLGVFAASLLATGMLAARGALPRTRPVMPGEAIRAD